MAGDSVRTCWLCGGAIQTVVTITTLTLFIAPTPTSAELNLPLENFRYWAEEFGSIITGVASRATAVTEIQTEYLLQDPQIKHIDGKKMVQKIKENMETMLRKKVHALSGLVDVAEKAHSEHVYDPHISRSYPKAKRLNTTEFVLEENEHFNYIPVNLTMSTVHVPTNVYDESVEVLNGVDWSEALDEYFRENYQNDPTLTWQYFGSASGFFRNYPGMRWPINGVDLFDCRTRGWYIQAATSPKDIVILLDASGSMKGLRMEIAKATVEKILETLSDDDFFNVIKFSMTPEYVDDCFNGTLVQANADNKKRVKEALGNIRTTEIAQFDKALTEAFELLQMMNATGKGAQCNRAIMLITDGAPETYEEIFKRYNWPEKHVRVFTFLIGREVGDSRQVHWMACSNKGYYSHISTLADVHEHVQNYIHVISRPMVIDRADHTIWTSVYVDAAHNNEGLQLMTSVAAPVYDTKNGSTNSGILLGVMGTDVPLKELTKLTPKYKLGVNGYAFAITNNGYVLFHPDFRPTEGGLIKPNYNSVDLAEVELLDTDEIITEPDVPTPQYDMELRRRMVDRETGSLKMRVKVHYDDMHRVSIREQQYYFTDIDGTPFSLGIALPEGYGMNWVDGLKSLDKADLAAFSSTKIKVASWNYCKMETNETRQDPAEMLRKYLEYGKNDNPLYTERCDNELIESIVFDAEATRGVLASWLKENRDGTLNGSASKKNGVEIIFLGTKGGLTRYHVLTENLTEPDFIHNNTNTIEELYYIQAVEGGEKIFTFSVPFDAAQRYPNVVVTASTPIIVREADKSAVAMVVGMQMRYDKFHEFFMNTTMRCPHKSGKCNLTCASSEIDCYLLDNNGYVVFSENPSEELGIFFGAKDRSLMSHLIKDENDQDRTRGVFKRVQMFDYQGVCQIWRKGSSSARSIFINPFSQLYNIVWWFIHKLAWFAVEFNIFNLWPNSLWAASVDENEAYYAEDVSEQDMSCALEAFNKLSKIGTEEQVYRWKNELVKLNPTDYTNCDEIQSWFDTIYNQWLRTRRDEPCVEEYFNILAMPDALPLHGTTSANMCPFCVRSYSIHKVAYTNLMLLAVDVGSFSDTGSYNPLEPREVIYNDTMMCQRLQTPIYRRRPGGCYSSHKLENSSDCGRGSLNKPSVLLVIACLLLHRAPKHQHR